MRSIQGADVSVVIPCYRCAEDLPRAVASVFAQSKCPVEVVLVEDASLDGGKTRDCVNSLKAGFDGRNGIHIVTICLDENIGPGGARNVGWNAASGHYVAFLDADDAWHPSKLEHQYTWMGEHPSCDLSGHRSIYTHTGEVDKAPFDSEISATNLQLSDMLFSNRILTRTVMLRRSLIQRFGRSRYCEDYALWLRMICDGCILYVLDAELAYTFRPEFGAGGQSAQLWEMEKAEIQLLLTLGRSKRIDVLTLITAMGFSVLKFLRRSFIRWIAP